MSSRRSRQAVKEEVKRGLEKAKRGQGGRRAALSALPVLCRLAPVHLSRAVYDVLHARFPDMRPLLQHVEGGCDEEYCDCALQCACETAAAPHLVRVNGQNVNTEGKVTPVGVYHCAMSKADGTPCTHRSDHTWNIGEHVRLKHGVSQPCVLWLSTRVSKDEQGRPVRELYEVQCQHREGQQPARAAIPQPQQASTASQGWSAPSTPASAPASPLRSPSSLSSLSPLSSSSSGSSDSWASASSSSAPPPPYDPLAHPAPPAADDWQSLPSGDDDMEVQQQVGGVASHYGCNTQLTAPLVVGRLQSTVWDAESDHWPMDVNGQWTGPLDRADEREAPLAVVDDEWDGPALESEDACIDDGLL